MKDRIPLYTVFITDELNLPQLKDIAVGVPSIMEWVHDLPNERNKKFVGDYKSKYESRRRHTVRRATMRSRSSTARSWR